jgi:23S rRNA pseudouridine2605 synthase
MKPSDKENNKLRLQVFLSRNGVCSRRQALELIEAGRVSVNGRVTREPSAPVEPGEDKICFDQREIKPQAYEYVLLNKAKGYTTTKSDPHALRTIYDLLPQRCHHLLPAGRLDQDTEGLLLLTNDGDIIFQLTHPKFNVDKTYAVGVDALLKAEDKKKLESGVFIDQKRTAPAKVHDIRYTDGQTNFLLTIHEGRKRQIRLMLDCLGYQVRDLKRLTQGPFSLGGLRTGECRPLTPDELKKIDAMKKRSALLSQPNEEKESL